MGNGLRGRLTYSNVAATLALFLAIGGGMAFALASNSVKSRHIKNGQVKTPDIRTGAVNSSKLATGAVTTSKLGNGAVTAAKLSGDATEASVTLAGLADGLPGCQVGFGDVWADQSPNVNHSAGWIEEPTGLVHLQGVVRRCNAATETVFTLPAGVRPVRLVHLTSRDESGDVREVSVHSTGDVTVPGAPVNEGIFLDGLSFPVAGIASP
jgi:hypothetical protein